MSVLSAFFKRSGTESGTHLGVFYPTGYLLAVFPDFASSQAAARKLRTAGFEEKDVIAVDGRELIILADEHARTEGALSTAMHGLSRLFATEEAFNEQDLRMAAAGAAILLVKAPTEKLKAEAWHALESENPVAARHYAKDGIDHLAGDLRTT